ncbi:hypothetical protein AAMO2058_001107500 [Amorphochlora amoebiformis]
MSLRFYEVTTAGHTVSSHDQSLNMPFLTILRRPRTLAWFRYGVRSLSQWSQLVSVKPQGQLEISLVDDSKTAVPTFVDLETENQKCDTVSLNIESLDGVYISPEVVRLESNGQGGARLVTLPGFSPGPNGVKITGVIPEKFGVSAVTGGSSFKLPRLEGSLSVRTGGGAVMVDKLNEGPYEIHSHGGDVDCRVLNGNGTIRTGGGALNSKRVTGINLNADTAGGAVDLRAVYVTHCRVCAGEITVGSVHGNTKFSTNGKPVVIESGMDGEIEINTAGGEADLQIGSSAKEVVITSEGGDVRLRLPSDLNANVEAKGKRGVLVDDGLKDHLKYQDMTCQHAKGTVPAHSEPTSQARGYTPSTAQINIDAGTGFVELRGKDWLASLGSKFQKLRDLK